MRTIILKTFFSFFLIISFSIFYQNANAGENDLNKMHDAFGRAFGEAQSGNTKAAAKNFIKAGKFAQDAENWNGIIDAGNALRNVGEKDKAQDFFESAYKLAKKSNDWHQLIGSGYAFASLSGDKKITKLAAQAFQKAGDASAKAEDWFGITEAANGLINIKDNSAAASLLDQGLAIVRKTSSLSGCRALSRIYNQLNLSQKVTECKQLESELAQFSGEFQGRSKARPPKGWSPVGESVTGPPKLDIETQKAIRASADEDIRQKHEYIMQQKKLEDERRQAAEYHSGYYYYPHGSSYGTYTVWTKKNNRLVGFALLLTLQVGG